MQSLRVNSPAVGEIIEEVFRMLIKRKGQSTLEYAMIIAIVAGGLIAMQIYMKRGVEGKMQESADSIGQQFDASKTIVKTTTKRAGISVEQTTGGVTTVYSDGKDASGVSKADVVEFFGTETVDVLESAAEEEAEAEE